VVGEAVRYRDEPVDRRRPVFLHPAWEIHPHDLEVVAEVAGTDPARATRPAGSHGVHHDANAGLEDAAGRGLDDLGEGLVADDAAPRDSIVEVPLEDVQVGPADADPERAKERFARPGDGDRGLAWGEGPRALVEHRAHRARGCHETS